jgi:hypothetical protein
VTQGWGSWDASWVWCFGLFALTIAIHAVGVVVIARILVRIYAGRRVRKHDYVRSITNSIATIVIVALSLAALHLIESTIWAFVYLHVGAVSTAAAAELYSVDSMTTRGSSGLHIEPNWRMMGAAEAGNGMLLFGISTAFLFAVMQRLLTRVSL